MEREKDERKEFSQDFWDFLPLFKNIWYVNIFIKTLKIISISTNIYRPYVCDPLGPYISRVYYCIEKIIPYW